MKISKLVLLFTVVFLIMTSCGREEKAGNPVLYPESEVVSEIEPVPRLKILKDEKGRLTLFYQSKGLYKAVFDKKWSYLSVTDVVGDIRDGWSTVLCGGRIRLIAEGVDDHLYLIDNNGGSFKKFRIGRNRFSSLGVESDAVCDESEVLHFVVYDPLTEVLFYYSEKDKFQGEDVVQGIEISSPHVRVTYSGRVYVAYIDKDKDHVMLAFKDPGSKWQIEDTGFQGDMLSFEISAYGADLASVYPRVAVRTVDRRGIVVGYRKQNGWEKRKINFDHYISDPIYFATGSQEGVVVQDTYWEDLDIAVYDGYQWRVGNIVSAGATGYAPSIFVDDDKLYTAYYSMDTGGIYVVEVKLPWH